MIGLYSRETSHIARGQGIAVYPSLLAWRGRAAQLCGETLPSSLELFSLTPPGTAVKLGREVMSDGEGARGSAAGAGEGSNDYVLCSRVLT